MCLVLFLVVSSVLIACESKPQEETLEFTGEGDYWNMELIVIEDNDANKIDIFANYLGDPGEIEEVDTIQYTYEWLHEEAEFREEKDSVDFHGEDAESTVHMISIASALTRDEEKTFSGESFISEADIADNEINELADTIRINIEWNEQEEVFEIERLN